MRSPLQRLDVSLRYATPVALTLLVAILSVVPLRLPGHALLAPDVVLMTVFYWTVHRPDLMRGWAAFAVGLLTDVLTGAPLGVNALVLVLVHAALLAQHKVFRGKGFGLVWCAFALTVPAAHLVAAAAVLAVSGILPDPSVLGLRSLLTIALYPPVAWMMGRAQRAVLSSL